MATTTEKRYVDKEGLAHLVDTLKEKLAAKADAANVQPKGSYAELDANGQVKSSQLPSYVDDVMEFTGIVNTTKMTELTSAHVRIGVLWNEATNAFIGMFREKDSIAGTPIFSTSVIPVVAGQDECTGLNVPSSPTPETGKIYVEVQSNKSYRWSGSKLVEISKSLALGETAETAYSGEKGKKNADDIAALKEKLAAKVSEEDWEAKNKDVAQELADLKKRAVERVSGSVSEKMLTLTTSTVSGTEESVYVGAATQVRAGMMSAEDKKKLDTQVYEEGVRVENETAREQNEAQRKAAETARAQAETVRQTSESARAEAETVRETAFTAKAAEMDTAVKNCETATTGAEKVDATITEENVLEVTDREGAKKTLPLVTQAKAEEAAEDVERVKQSLGSYSDRPDVKLVATMTDMAVSKDGVLVAKQGWAIAEFTAEKGNEYLFKPNTVDGGVCIFAERVDKVEKRSIDYDFEYNEDGQIVKATATYLGKTHIYTYEYTAGDGGGTTVTITEEGVGTVDALPYQYTTTVGSYSPLVRLNDGAELPKDGYCRFMSHFKGNGALKVVVSYKVGSADLTMKVLRDGVFSSISTQLGNLSQKENETRNLAVELQEQFRQFVDTNPYVGMVRMNGDMSCGAEKNLGDSSLMHEVGGEWKLATVKNGEVTHVMAPGRLTLDVNGDEVKIDGTDGDVMLINENAYLLRGAKTIDGREMNVTGIGKKPASWYGISGKRLPPFGMTPCETVNVKLEGDVRQQAHCVYNKDAIGTYNTIIWPLFKETYKESGGGYSTVYVSAYNAIRMAQAKNEDQETACPYMGWYYEMYEALLATMYAEFGSLYVEGVKNFGTGCARNNPTDSDWNGDDIAGNCGMRVLYADGAKRIFSIFDNAENISSGNKSSYIYGIDRGSYCFVEMLEEQRLLDGVARANLVEKIGLKDNVFSYDEDGNVTCVSDGSVNLSTGEGMEAKKFYYLVRDVPGCEGMTDGVMTAVVNRYVKFEFSDGYADASGNTLDGAVGIMKISLPVYRGFSLPLRGAFRQMSYAYWVVDVDADGNISNDYYCHARMEDVKPVKGSDKAYYVKDDGTLPDLVKDMAVVRKGVFKGTVSESGAMKTDYNTSLFCHTKLGSGLKSYENAYQWIYSKNNGGKGSITVHGSVVGCGANIDRASARSAVCFNAASIGHGYYAGAFAVQLKTKQS